MGELVNKPPLGLIPKNVHEWNRLKQILAAIDRYETAGHGPIPTAWYAEYVELSRKHLDI